MGWKAVLAVVSVFGVLLTGAEAAQKSDERLNTKITYFSGYVRLSDAVTEIGKLAKIKVYAGKSTSDWQVRDMPVVVCANDIEVGKLLKMMTDTYFLSQSVTEVDGSPVYRLYRTQNLTSQLDNHEKAVADYGKQLRDLTRDSLTWAGSLSSSDADKLYAEVMRKNSNVLNAGYGDTRLGFDEYAMYGKLVKALGEDGLARLSNGESITLSAQQGGSVGELVKEYARLRCRVLANRMAVANGIPLDEKPVGEPDLDNATIRFEMQQYSSGQFALQSTMSGASSYSGTGFTGDISAITYALPRESLPKFPAEPPTDNWDLKEIARSSDLDSEAKYELEKPADMKNVKLADVITAVSKATGYTIVADDYTDHKTHNGDNPYVALFGGRVSLRDIKNAVPARWYVDSESKRLILRNWSWCDNYNHLVPRTLFEGLLKKANSSGVGLADVVACGRLVFEQRSAWITNVDGLEQVAQSLFRADAQGLLKLIGGIRDQDMERALSVGVPMVSLPAEQYARALNRLPEGTTKPKENVSQLRLRLIKENADTPGAYKYTVCIDGMETHLRVPMDVTFPIYSEVRQKELEKASRK